MQKMDDKKPAHYSELLERNPALKKNRLTRIFVSAIIMGARINPRDWPRFRMVTYSGPFLLMVLLFNYFFATEDTPQYKQTITAILIFCCFFWIPPLFAAVYGYRNKDKIDTTGGVKVDFGFLKRYFYIWALIGVGVSTGVGFFGWFNVK